ncbi:MAG: hypothetical protein RM338_17355 [Nostoc sp. DedQUE12a]|nr:hypothetical protein [Nostoc sp. DedQUE12a]
MRESLSGITDSSRRSLVVVVVVDTVAPQAKFCQLLLVEIWIFLYFAIGNLGKLIGVSLTNPAF